MILIGNNQTFPFFALSFSPFFKHIWYKYLTKMLDVISFYRKKKTKQKIDCSPEVRSSTQHEAKENFLTERIRKFTIHTHTVEANFLANVHPVCYFFSKHRLCITSSCLHTYPYFTTLTVQVSHIVICSKFCVCT